MTGRVANFFLKQGKLVIIDGTGEEADVYARIEAALQKMQEGQLPAATEADVDLLMQSVQPPAPPAPGPAGAAGTGRRTGRRTPARTAAAASRRTTREDAAQTAETAAAARSA